MINKIVRFFKNSDYCELKEEWEAQNIIVHKQQIELDKKTMKIKELEIVKSSYEKLIDNLVIEKEELKKELEEKEFARRKSAGKVGGYVAENNKLKKQVEFLKTNRRSPNLEELKDYELRRKRVNKI